MRRGGRSRQHDPAGDLALIANHARLDGLFGNPRQVYADSEAEQAAIEGYGAGCRERLEARPHGVEVREVK